MRHHIMLYLAFVGVPGLLLVGVLHAGRDIQPPQSVGGRWKLAADGELASALGCAPAQEDDPVVLRVGQSGRNLRLELRDGKTVALQGQINGNQLKAEAKPKHEKTPAVRINAQLDRENKPHALSGTVEVAGCAGEGGPTGTVPFHATREVTTGGVL